MEGMLNELLPRLVPGSCGATTTVWDGTAEPPTAATHPDLAELVRVQLRDDDGPIPTALRTGTPVHAGDLLHDSRWPGYRASALDTGIRASATFPFHRDGVEVTVTLYHLRPGGLEGAAQGPPVLLGGLLADSIVRDRRYRQVLATVDELDTALRSRPVVDQACGILMHLMGCDADAAFAVLRRASQHTNRKLADLARAVVATRGAVLPRTGRTG
ncbi:GAF and ANTAR domain-containing protein [Streptomyces sp. NPDC053048]|uniref:GAF and ANTAR domain-containing protein n=1 Tax=Streptomyces sp. NPDC053048 TaxID=3365694 RepID=UPI0037D57CA1